MDIVIWLYSGDNHQGNPQKPKTAISAEEPNILIISIYPIDTIILIQISGARCEILRYISSPSYT